MDSISQSQPPKRKRGGQPGRRNTPPLPPFHCAIHGAVEPRVYPYPGKKNPRRVCPLCAKKWNKTNYQRHKEQAKARRERNKLARPNYMSEWRAANEERARAAVRKWHQEHREAMRYHCRVRHMRKTGATISDFTFQQWQELLEEYRHCCAYCGQQFDKLTQDHVIPLSKGGNHTKSNVVPACQSCNSRKHDKLMP